MLLALALARQFWMPPPDPLTIDLQEEYAVRIPSLIIHALQLGHVDLVLIPVASEDRPSLRMDATHDDGLRHTFQHHAQQEHSSYFNVAGQVHKNLP